MKKVSALIVMILFVAVRLAGATNVSGVISSNTTWNVAGSPYIVVSSVTVQNGVTLTVQSGVTVKFNDSQYMVVNGVLNATGTTFTSNNAAPTPGIWPFIQVGDGTVTNVGSLIMNSCQVLYANYMDVYRGSASLTNTDLLNFNSYGVQVDANGTLNMSGGSISTGSANAAASGSCLLANSGSSSTLSGVAMHNTNYGIFLAGGSSVDITNLTISGCKWPVWYSGSAAFTTHGTNTMTGNTNTAVYMGFSSLAGSMTLPAVSIPYYFPSGMTVTATGSLTVASTNILKFQAGTWLDVSGTFVANANPAENIFFTSFKDDNWGGDTNNDGTLTAPAQSDWYGVRFEDPSNDAGCLMQRCKLRYAGYGNGGGISMFNASPTINLCDISNNYYGFYVQYASNPTLSNNTIGSSVFTPIAMSFEANPSMPNNTLSFSDNAYDAIGLLGGTLTANATIIKRNVTAIQNITYLLLNTVTVPVGMTLTINKGIVIKSYNYSHRIIVDGTLNCIATVDSTITFTSSKDDNYGNPGDSNKDGTITSPAVGDWGGIVYNAGSTGALNYCRLKYASYTNYTFATCSTYEYINGAGLTMIDASPSVSNCEFKDLNYGISCYRSSSPVISNNSMINIAYTPFCIASPSDPLFTGNTFTNVTWKAIGLLGGNVCQNGIIKQRTVAGYTNITYVLLSDMYINSGTYISVDPGVVIKVNGCNIYVDGGFKTNGLVAQQIVFSSLKDDNVGNPFDTNGDGNATSPASGNWGGIKFRATSDDAYCNLAYTNLKYGGNTGEGIVTFENAGGQVNNCSVSNSSYYGLYINGNSTPPVTNVSIQNCAQDPIALSLLSNPTFTGISFAANRTNALKIIEGTLSANANLIPRNVAGFTNIPYIIDGLTISSNATLTVQPGVIFKFNYWYSNINVLGHLIAKGLAGNKIYFTSLRDDSRGGDSNNDGNSTVPAKGDWGYYTGGIQITSHSNDTITNCEISYPLQGIYFNSGHALVDNCVIQQVSDCGMDIYGSSWPVISNDQFNNITNSPIKLSMFSTPTFSNCSSLNVGRMALTVRSETFSQNGTIPVRNFGGYNNITYYMEGACTVNTGTTINVPAGIVFKSNGANGFIVNGQLNIQGVNGNTVIFSDFRDDLVGNLPDMNQDGSATAPPSSGWGGTWITFDDISNDASSVQYANFKYANTGIAMVSASPTIANAGFKFLTYGADLNGVSQPHIDNCNFQNLQYYPMQISLVSFPASLTNNTISGTTYKVIKVRDETLTQDVTLLKQSFGGVSNIAYLFGAYTVGTGATLTISPGVVCKFLNGGGITVNKGLMALGQFAADQNIVFTDYRDDFYGGDSNSDANATSPSIGFWNGLYFNDQSLDPSCQLQHCFIKYAYYGINTTSASPTLNYCSILQNSYGVYATAASNPVLHFCDFKNNYYWAVDNVNKSFVIDATNCWWGSNLGPVVTNTQGNGTSAQELITTSVNYAPYATTGNISPMMGDVSLNGIVQAYDASLLLQYTVGNITLNSTQQTVADVSATGGITPFDGSLILQYVVGLISSFPAEQLRPVNTSLQDPVLTVGSANVKTGDFVSVPLRLSSDSGMVSAYVRLKYDPANLEVVQAAASIPGQYISYRNDSVAGMLYLSLAGTDPLTTDTTLAVVTFKAVTPSGNVVSTELTVDNFLANETDATANAIPGTININGNMTGIDPADDSGPAKLYPVYPNPSNGNATLVYRVGRDGMQVNISVFSMNGQPVATLVNETTPKGRYSISLSGLGTLEAGSYLIRMTAGTYKATEVFQVTK